MNKPKMIILTGPTAVGKTELSIRLAKEIGGEIISADSMQVYRGMDIGTAKITEDEMQGVRHHLIDCLNPDEEFNVAIYWDSDALILAETWAIVYSRDGEPVDSKIFANRDSRLIGRWKSITGASRIVLNSDGTGSFNGSSFSNWCTIGDYILYKFTGNDYYSIDAYRFSGDILQLGNVDPTYQDWDDNRLILNYAKE